MTASFGSTRNVNRNLQAVQIPETQNIVVVRTVSTSNLLQNRNFLTTGRNNPIDEFQKEPTMGLVKIRQNQRLVAAQKPTGQLQPLRSSFVELKLIPSKTALQKTRIGSLRQQGKLLTFKIRSTQNSPKRDLLDFYRNRNAEVKEKPQPPTLKLHQVPEPHQESDKSSTRSVSSLSSETPVLGHIFKRPPAILTSRDQICTASTQSISPVKRQIKRQDLKLKLNSPSLPVSP